MSKVSSGSLRLSIIRPIDRLIIGQKSQPYILFPLSAAFVFILLYFCATLFSLTKVLYGCKYKNKGSVRRGAGNNSMTIGPLRVVMYGGGLITETEHQLLTPTAAVESLIRVVR